MFILLVKGGFMKLTNEQLASLKDVLKGDNTAAARQALAVLALHMGASTETLSKVFNKNQVWLDNVCSKLQTQGASELFKVKLSPGRPPRYTTEQRQAICELRRSRPDWTLKRLKEEVHSQLGLKISLPTVRTIITAAGFKYTGKRQWGQQ